MWLWVCLSIPTIFLIIWFWVGPRLVENDLKKTFVKLLLIVIVLDCLLTFIAQPDYYWSNYSRSDELAVVGEHLLSLHPIAFSVGIVFWIILITFLIRKTSFFLCSVLFFSLFTGHFIALFRFRIGDQLKSIVKQLLKIQMDYSQKMIYEEIFEYLSYLFIAVVFGLVLKKIQEE